MQKSVAKVERHFIEDRAFRNDRVDHNLKFTLTRRPIRTMFEVFKSHVSVPGKIPDHYGIMTQQNRYFSEV